VGSNSNDFLYNFKHPAENTQFVDKEPETFGASARTPLPPIVQPARLSGSYNWPMKVVKAQGFQLAFTVCDFEVFVGTLKGF
jgi:hypothetical protein